MSDYTPGPWAYREHNAVFTAIGAKKAVFIADTNPQSVYASDDEAERDANTRLIAAAPELLEALQVLLMACSYKEGNSTHLQAEAAIAKATDEAVQS